MSAGSRRSASTAAPPASWTPAMDTSASASRCGGTKRRVSEAPSTTRTRMGAESNSSCRNAIGLPPRLNASSPRVSVIVQSLRWQA
ncbi:hypothetical protein [Corallococcus sp. AB049A]|uniref:hypothetical protein n=1 Tax=Corallococcus sp. AB049A TaxID=2316721 RepID=UPI0018F58AA1|nr:hypothetical protein [Corallococcus sp. AB049A]